MDPKKICVKCPNCKEMSKPIPATMGDKKIKCGRCKSFIQYGWRDESVTIIDRPERITSSGLVLY